MISKRLRLQADPLGGNGRLLQIFDSNQSYHRIWGAKPVRKGRSCDFSPSLHEIHSHAAQLDG